MRDNEVFEAVKGYVEDSVLKGQGEVEGDTPLLEWGILDSLSVARLGNFVEKRFEVVLPTGSAVGERFHSLDSICAFVTELRAGRTEPEPAAPHDAA
ncbi:Acyl carrier protein [Streptomyces qinglanensis]|uniref:Acyl carrier protein n=1 Tax=Streptomyces qinglanensis TaxID=943816 RepID=A0A1H9RTF9_9ACTN|nr:Acyl carrier protein [Streptomyces qinglanensis]